MKRLRGSSGSEQRIEEAELQSVSGRMLDGRPVVGDQAIRRVDPPFEVGEPFFEISIEHNEGSREEIYQRIVWN